MMKCSLLCCLFVVLLVFVPFHEKLNIKLELTINAIPCTCDEVTKNHAKRFIDPLSFVIYTGVVALIVVTGITVDKMLVKLSSLETKLKEVDAKHNETINKLIDTSQKELNRHEAYMNDSANKSQTCSTRDYISSYPLYIFAAFTIADQCYQQLWRMKPTGALVEEMKKNKALQKYKLPTRKLEDIFETSRFQSILVGRSVIDTFFQDTIQDSNYYDCS